MIPSDTKVPAIAVFSWLTRKYDAAWLEWAPDVLLQTLQKDTGARPAHAFMDRALAMQNLATRTSFWVSWEPFGFLAMALNGAGPRAHEIPLLSVGQMWVAVDSARWLQEHLQHHIDTEFSTEVLRFMATQALYQGVWWLPSPLDIVNRFSLGTSYKCRDCGDQSEVNEYGVCNVCSGRFATDVHLGEMRPDPHLIARGKGTNLEIFYKNPPGEVPTRYAQMLAHPDTPVREAAADMCAVALVASANYASAQRALADTYLKEIQ